MDSFEWNKIFGAILGTLLLVMVVREIGLIAFHEEPLEQQAYKVDVPDAPAASGAVVEEEAGPVNFRELLDGASVAAGERVAARCVSCHSFEKDGPNKVGPNLWGILGAPIGQVDGFNYSRAMVAYGEEVGVWGFQNMYDYLEDPRSYIRGTLMAFAGLSRQRDRANILAYMREMSDTPIPVPAPPVTEEPDPVEAGAVEGEESAPTEGTPADSTPAEGTPADETAPAETPAEPAPAEDTAPDEAPAEEPAPEETPAEDPAL